jgi:DNA repair protein RadC
MNRIQDIPTDDRPRERLLKHGAAALSDRELLALFINTGLPGENAIAVAQRLLKTHGGLRQLARLTPQQLKAEKALGPAKTALLCAAFQIGKRAVQQEIITKALDHPEAIFQFLASDMQSLNREVVRVVMLDTRLRFICQEEVSTGALNQAFALPRDILRPAIIHSAYAIVMVHNHPSGDPTPSEADTRLTRTLNEAAKLLNIKLLDHVIIGAPSPERSQAYFSFRESGVL